MEIRFSEGKANAHFKDFIVETGVGSPSPFELFVVSLGACAALTAASYCRKQGLSAEGLLIKIDVTRHPETRLASTITMEYGIPSGFPDSEVNAMVEAAGDCFVKKHLYTPPEFEVLISRN